MTTEQQKSLEQASELSDNTDVSQPTKTITQKLKWLFLLGAIATIFRFNIKAIAVKTIIFLKLLLKWDGL